MIPAALNCFYLFGRRPGGRRFSRLAVFAGVLILLVCILFSIFLVPSVTKFTLVDKKTGKLLYYSDVKPGDTFTVTYTHSVNKSPVEDVFAIGPDNSIMLTKTIFHSFGAGIPTEPEAGQTFRIFEDRMEVDNINRVLKEYLLFVGVVADHTFTMKGQTIKLNQLVSPQQTIRFQVKKLPVYTLLRGINHVER